MSMTKEKQSGKAENTVFVTTFTDSIETADDPDSLFFRARRASV
jgi:hypothetical protein